MRILRGLRLKVLALGGLTMVAFLAGLVGNGKPAVGQSFTWVCNICSPVVDPLCEDCRNQVRARDEVCKDSFDATCVSKALRLCDRTKVVCPCEHSVCEAGPAMHPDCDRFSPRGACVAKVTFYDRFCASVWWDDVCVNIAAQSCGGCP